MNLDGPVSFAHIISMVLVFSHRSPFCSLEKIRIIVNGYR